jgi:hypothetical protein
LAASRFLQGKGHGGKAFLRATGSFSQLHAYVSQSHKCDIVPPPDDVEILRAQTHFDMAKKDFLEVLQTILPFWPWSSLKVMTLARHSELGCMGESPRSSESS